ncbi:MAG: hypothetical protein NC114_06325 [Ruminococcus flavefaciens]|nr:hypothetical protein [Ruminococcus flavefaciens]
MKDFRDFLLANQDKKNPIETVTSMVQYPTGFMYLDYGTGSYLTVHDEQERPLYQYHNVGIPQGSVNTIIAKSQGGKTTLTIAMAVAIIESYINPYIQQAVCHDIIQHLPKKKFDFSMEGAPFVEILDTEKTLPVDYVKKIAQYTNSLTKSHIIINPITTDRDLMVALDRHVKFKVAHMKKIPMPMLDMFGNPIFDYPPTVMIVDSASQLLLEDCDDPSMAKKGEGILDIYNSATQNTAGARRAKVITALYSQIVNYAKKYNVLVFMINHINKMLPVNGIPVKQYRGLRGGETIGGGEKAIYLTANILRLDVIKSIGYESSTSLNLGDGITGFIAKASWIKSKSNSRSNSTMLCYTNKAGYDPLLSSLYQGRENGDLLKSGNFHYVKGYEKLKFSLKNYGDVFGDHPELYMAYYDELKEKCSVLLDNPEVAIAHDRQLTEKIRDDIHQDFSGSDAMDMDDMFAQMINS